MSLSPLLLFSDPAKFMRVFSWDVNDESSGNQQTVPTGSSASATAAQLSTQQYTFQTAPRVPTPFVNWPGFNVRPQLISSGSASGSGQQAAGSQVVAKITLSGQFLSQSAR